MPGWVGSRLFLCAPLTCQTAVDLALRPVIPYCGGMEVHFTPETEQKLKDLAAASGRATDELVEDAVAGYFAEAAEVRDLLDNRYDDLESGRVKPIPGEEVIARLRAKSAASRTKRDESL